MLMRLLGSDSLTGEEGMNISIVCASDNYSRDYLYVGSFLVKFLTFSICIIVRQVDYTDSCCTVSLSMSRGLSGLALVAQYI